jgi:hypothetical protein
LDEYTEHTSDPTERLIDWEQTGQFDRFCHGLVLAEQGDVNVRKQILNLGREAAAHIDKMLNDVGKSAEAIPDMLSIYSKNELQILRTGEGLTQEIVEKIGSHILMLTAFIMRDHPEVKSVPDDPALLDTFIFRQSVCAYVWALRSVGGPAPTNVQRVRNDIIDTNFATYATFFDGLMSADKRANGIYADATNVLCTFGLEKKAWHAHAEAAPFQRGS